MAEWFTLEITGVAKKMTFYDLQSSSCKSRLEEVVADTALLLLDYSPHKEHEMFSEKQWLPTAENPILLHEFIEHIPYFAQSSVCIEYFSLTPIHLSL